MTPSGQLLLAGGGHSHALLLKRWAMTPRLRPTRGIVLVNRHPTALYSGMVPGLIAGLQRGDPNALELLVDGYVRSPQSYEPVPGQAKAWIPAAHHAGLWAALRTMAKTATEAVVRRRISWVAASLR